jgi:pyruvate kinase
MITIKQGFIMEDRMMVVLPGAVIDLPTLMDKDEDDLLEFGVKHNMDFVSASYVRKASDVEYIRGLLAQKGSNMRIISKI